VERLIPGSASRRVAGTPAEAGSPVGAGQ